MTLISNSNRVIRTLLGALSLVCVLFYSAGRVQADDTAVSQTLSVSPTLFQMNATPGQTWQSEIRVINVNNYDITVYPQVVNFAPQGETGQGDFIPVFASETNGQTLAEWVDMTKEGITIPKQQTVSVPFTIHCPPNAAPGGHYAAILIGTKSGSGEGESALKTAQFVSSLFFVRVAGDVQESGTIREFRSTETILQSPEATFEVRFQNTGNVHLQPQGDITIYNMWGEERGTIPINHQTHFGNVLPQSIRKFTFTWKSEESAFDIGRYRAVVTLGYGEDTKSFVTSTTYFWIVPYTQILIFLGGLFGFIWFFTFAVKMYIRRMLVLSGIAPHQLPARMHAARPETSFTTDESTMHIGRYQTVTAPVRSSVNDLLTQLRSPESEKEGKFAVLLTYIKNYRMFFISAAVLLGLIFCIALIWTRMHTEARPYQVTIENPGARLTISSEAIYYDNLKAEGSTIPPTVVPEYADLELALVNVSGELGLAAKLRMSLENSGYQVASVDSDMGRSDEKTKIIYNPEEQDAALALSKRLGGAMLSVNPNTPAKHLTIYVGTDQK